MKLLKAAFAAFMLLLLIIASMPLIPVCAIIVFAFRTGETGIDSAYNAIEDWENEW